MSQFAVVFPGQGSQYVGMGRDLAAVSRAARDVFAEDDETRGEPISTVTFEGPEDRLNQTVNSQPAILTTSIAYVWALEDRLGRLPPASYFAGHSMGQYTAMVVSGVLSFSDGIRLVRERGRQMQASGSGGAMAAIIGLADEKLPDVLAAGEKVGVLTVANRNSPGQVVVSGERAAVDAASDAARELGAKRALLLPVSVAAHSPLMANAAQRMREILADVEFNDPRAPLIANADARLLTTGEECRAELVDHLTRGVDWIAAIERLTGAGIDRFIEVAPGKVLTGLIRRIAPEAEVFALDDQSAENRLATPPFIQAAADVASTATGAS